MQRFLKWQNFFNYPTINRHRSKQCNSEKKIQISKMMDSYLWRLWWFFFFFQWDFAIKSISRLGFVKNFIENNIYMKILTEKISFRRKETFQTSLSNNILHSGKFKISKMLRHKNHIQRTIYVFVTLIWLFAIISSIIMMCLS